MTGRGHGFPDGIEKNHLTKFNEKRKIKHINHIFYISGFIENKPRCRFCNLGFNEIT